MKESESPEELGPSKGEQEGRRALAEVLERQRVEIETRWLKRVASDLAVSHVPPTELKDGIGEYLQALAATLRNGQSLARGGTTAWAEIAREHALTRVRLGFDVDELVHELMLLRQTMTDVLHEHLSGETNHSARLADLVDAAIAAAVKSYVEARDYAARRQEGSTSAF